MLRLFNDLRGRRNGILWLQNNVCVSADTDVVPSESEKRSNNRRLKVEGSELRGES